MCPPTVPLAAGSVWYHRAASEWTMTRTPAARLIRFVTPFSAMLAAATALAADRTDCDGLAGREMLTCIEEHWPKVYAAVEGACKEAEKPRDCRVTGYAASRITFVPGSKGGGAGSTPKTAAKAEAGASDAAEYVTIRFVGAQIGPGKAGGSNWDGTGNISPEAAEAMLAVATQGASLSAAGAAGTASSVALNAAVQGTAAPDVIGSVRVVGPTRTDLAKTAGTWMALATPAQKVEDSYTPTFTYQMEYQNWPVYEDTRFELSLWDGDLSQNDPIGVVQISKTNIDAALAKGSILEVPVGDQSSGQIVSVKISVMHGSSAVKDAKMNGYKYGG